MSNIFQKPPFNYQYKVGIENAIDYDNDDTTITGVATDLVSGSVFMPRNVFVRDGQRLLITCGGTTVGTGSKTWQLRANGLNLISTNALTPATNTGWNMRCEIFRRNNSSMHVHGLFTYNAGNTAGAAAPAFVSNVNVNFANITDLLNTDITFTMEVDIGIAGETIRQTMMLLSIL